MKLAILGLALSLLAACGKIEKQETTREEIGGGGDAEPTTPHALTVANAAQKPGCSAANEGQIIFVLSEQSVQTCVGGIWQRLNLGGAADGNGSIRSSIYCEMKASQEALLQGGLDKATAEGMTFYYNITQFENNAQFVQGRVSDGTTSTGASNFWHSAQEGFKTATSEAIVFDVAGEANGGFWYFTIDKTLTQDEVNSFAAVYVDKDMGTGHALLFDVAKECTIAEVPAQ